jgi:hypothetical protein
MIRWNAQTDEITVHRVVQEILQTSVGGRAADAPGGGDFPGEFGG